MIKIKLHAIVPGWNIYKFGYSTLHESKGREVRDNMLVILKKTT